MKFTAFQFRISRPALLCGCLFAALCLISIPQLRAQDEAAIEKALERAIREIQSSDGAERRKAAYALNALGQEALPALPHIIKGLSDSEEQVWFQCVQLIAKLGPDAADAIPALVENIRNPGRRYRNQVWYRATFALGRIGPASVPTALEFLNDSRDSIRSAGAKVLGWMGADAAAHIDSLLPLLQDESSEVRQYTAEALGLIGQEAISPLISILKSSENVNARIAATEALAGMQQEAAKTKQLIANTLSGDDVPFPLVVSSVKAIGSFRLQSDEIIQLIEPALASSDESVWEACASALIQSSDRGASAARWLNQELQSEDLTRVTRAIGLTQNLGTSAESAAPQLIALADSTDEDIARQARSALGYIGKPLFLPLIIKLAPEELDDSLGNRWEIEILRQIGHLTATELTTTLNSETDTVLWAALDVIGFRAMKNPEMAVRIRELTFHPKPTLRIKSLKTLNEVGTAPSIMTPIVQRLMNDTDFSVRAQAIQQIPSLGDAATSLESQIIQGLDSRELPIRLASIEALPYLPSIPESLPAKLVGSLDGVNAHQEKLAIVSALRDLGTNARQALPTLLSLPQPEDEKFAAALIEAFSKMGPDDEKVREIILGYLTSAQENLRLAAFQSLKNLTLSDEIRISHLKLGLQDSSRTIREIAADAAGSLGREASALGPSLFTLLESPGDASFAIEALRQIRIRDVDPYMNALNNKESSVRLFAAEALGRIGKDAESALPALRSLSENDDYEPVRRTASLAVRQIIRAQ